MTLATQAKDNIGEACRFKHLYGLPASDRPFALKVRQDRLSFVHSVSLAFIIASAIL